VVVIAFRQYLLAAADAHQVIADSLGAITVGYRQRGYKEQQSDQIKEILLFTK
jgi:hypothetical protein